MFCYQQRPKPERRLRYRDRNAPPQRLFLSLLYHTAITSHPNSQTQRCPNYPLSNDHQPHFLNKLLPGPSAAADRSSPPPVVGAELTAIVRLIAEVVAAIGAELDADAEADAEAELDAAYRFLDGGLCSTAGLDGYAIII